MQRNQRTEVQLPIPLIQVLPYMGDTRSCHYWDIPRPTEDYDEVVTHWRLTRELQVVQ